MQAVFQIGSAHWRRALWSQGYAVSASILKVVHFLFDDIGSFSHAAAEKSGILEGWGVNALIAIELTDIDYFLLCVAPECLLLG